MVFSYYFTILCSALSFVRSYQFGLHSIPYSIRLRAADKLLPASVLRATISRPEADNDAIQPHDASKKFFIETHGCQMNLADSDVVRSVMLSSKYEQCDVLEEADLILVNTCAIRDNAEAKVWQRLKYFQSIRKKNKKYKLKARGLPYIGVLGCMAERLKTKLLEDSGVDFVAGPDAYRDLPKLMPRESVETESSSWMDNADTVGTSVEDVRKTANVQLSMEETYADITPVRVAEGNTHAFVTITRGCDNHCAFCIVPYTRGRERSRPVGSILKEVHQLVRQPQQQGQQDQRELQSNSGLYIGSKEQLDAEITKEIVLLGQNVNSYWDQLSSSIISSYPTAYHSLHSRYYNPEDEYEVAPGFTQKSKRRRVVAHAPISTTSGSMLDTAGIYSGSTTAASELSGAAAGGVRFGELLLRVAELNPEVRIRFQSPHPKDFPEEVLQIIADTPNICNSLHMPAQHGSSAVLDRMARGYSREAYLSLVERARSIISPNTPNGIGLGLSSDFISGFCGETEEEHMETISLMQEVGYDQAFTYSYSRRDQTFAGLHMTDDVTAGDKSRRLSELINTFQLTASIRNSLGEVGRLHVVLVEGPGKAKKMKQQQGDRSNTNAVTAAAETTTAAKVLEPRVWTGRTDTNKRVVFEEILKGDSLTDTRTVLHGLTQEEAREFAMLSMTSYEAQLVEHLRHDSRSDNSANAYLAEKEKYDEWIAQLRHNYHQTAYKYSAGQASVHCHVQNTLRTRRLKQQQVAVQRHELELTHIQKGSYVIVKILRAQGHTLRGAPIAVTNLVDANDLNLPELITRPRY